MVTEPSLSSIRKIEVSAPHSLTSMPSSTSRRRFLIGSAGIAAATSLPAVTVAAISRQANASTQSLGAVGNAEWTGVPLSALWERAGLVDEVCELVFEGADRGVPKEEPTIGTLASAARNPAASGSL
jgi:DMSO/TMAO reductase YedYZ molybdopterin-dependent catalytic subunit